MRTILEKDNPILRAKSESVPNSEFNSTWLKELIRDMTVIMQEKGAVGIAAPQIGISKRVIVIGTAYAKRRKPEVSIPDTALINPLITILSEETETGYEGCLNGGDLMGQVPRALKIKYSGYDVAGNFISKEASGLEARILQHEVDHLDGILFFDRVVDKESLITYDELRQRLQSDKT